MGWSWEPFPGTGGEQGLSEGHRPGSSSESCEGKTVFLPLAKCEILTLEINNTSFKTTEREEKRVKENIIYAQNCWRPVA